MSTPSNDTPLLTAAQVARALNVTRGWVYHHADELGALRLGDPGLRTMARAQRR